ncbi:ABC transporter ATP-binding protein [Shewanella sp. H8]|uniref:ABC transporter ATP-binding protein n=1 Tax=Shewanella sp. H8 TaxID=3342676 RepID=UPI0033152C57
MTLVGDISVIESDGYIRNIYIYSGITEYYKFIVFMGVGALIVLAFTTLFSMYATYKIAKFGSKIGVELSDNLYKYYISRPWLYHTKHNSSDYINILSLQCVRVTNGVIMPLLNFNAKVAVVIVISISLFWYDPRVASFGLIALSIVYFSLYAFVRNKLHVSDNKIVNAQRQRLKLMAESFGGIKEVLLSHKQSFYEEKYNSEGNQYSHSLGMNQAIGQVPRYAIEFFVYGLIICLVIYLVLSNSQNIGDILASLSIYALACFKLLPALQNVYLALTQVKGNINSFYLIEPDLIKFNDVIVDSSFSSIKNNNRIVFEKEILLTNISFTYNNKKNVLDNISLRIAKNSMIGLVGSSGSGKSTLIDILMGLIEPTEGSLFIDGDVISGDSIFKWQNVIGFVPQSVYLTDGTIEENVAFGVDVEYICHKRVDDALKLAHLDELVNTLEEGKYTKVGERGVQLSGGQKQRIGIARALYKDTDVLVFDEATSALDSISEKAIMDTISQLCGRKTIVIIAHRLSTIKDCDTIFHLENGKCVGVGTFDELIEHSPAFNKLANGGKVT